MSRNFSASLALLALLAPGPTLARTYSVIKGDTLSHIAAREFGRPIYGPKGSLQKLLQKNPAIQNPNRIYPAQLIHLSDDPIAEQKPAESLSPASPAPEAVPVQAKNEAPASTAQTQENSSKASFGLRLGVGVSKDELEGVDHERSFRTVLDSELQTKIDADFYYKPSEATRIGLSLGIKNGDFQDSNDGRFEGRTSALYKFSVFGDMTLADRWHLGLELGTEQSFFLRQMGAEAFGLEEVFVDFASVSAGFDIVAQESWRWGLLAQGSFHAPADAEDQDVRKGSSYAAATRLSYHWTSGYSVEGTLQFGRRHQGVNGIRQTTTERAAEIALRYEF